MILKSGDNCCIFVGEKWAINWSKNITLSVAAGYHLQVLHKGK